jgi:hypothetical protein
MVTIELAGRITETGRLEVELPQGLPSGAVRVILEIPKEAQTWTDEEIEELMHVEPKSGAQIVANLSEGWEDQDITDGAQWVEEQRHKRQEQHRW